MSMTKTEEMRTPIRPSYSLEEAQFPGEGSSSTASSTCRTRSRAKSIAVDIFDVHSEEQSSFPRLRAVTENRIRGSLTPEPWVQGVDIDGQYQGPGKVTTAGSRGSDAGDLVLFL
jgi:hypothetical protein